MRNFLPIGQVQVGHIQQALWMNPDLWNKHSFRKTFTHTPHSEVDDIWLRYMPDGIDMEDSGATEVVWHEEAKVLGPVVKETVLNLMRAVNGYQLDRLILSRLAPGGKILPHADKGAAYTAQQGIARYHVVVQGMPGSMFRCEDEEVNMRTGEIWWFNAHKVHSVVNNSSADRIHLLVDLRVWL